MERFGFKMKMKPGCAAEYKKRHDEIWPELKALISSTGVCDYSIFLDEETNILFGVQKVAGNASSQDLGNLEIVKKWWAYMSDIMETNPDNSPVTIPLKEVFRME
jgi:L-rhamnose mutarotase